MLPPTVTRKRKRWFASKADTPERETMKLNAYATSGTSPTSKNTRPDSPDFLVENHFTIFLLYPLSDSAKNWVEENLPSDRMTFGEGIVIEARCFWPILDGIQSDGLTAVPRG